MFRFESVRLKGAGISQRGVVARCDPMHGRANHLFDSGIFRQGAAEWKAYIANLRAVYAKRPALQRAIEDL